jgi:hypothetical protein
LDRHIFNESEMALFFECMPLCAQKVLDTADIVREAMFRQLPSVNVLFFRSSAPTSPEVRGCGCS